MSSFDHRTAVSQIPADPGVYRMLDEAGTVLYVGKAKNLTRRVSSYFGRALNRRLQVMVAQIADIQVTVTRTEGEALLLESDLIKTHQPRYNVLLRDDKSYPFIYLSTQDEFPRLSFYRGARKGSGRYFGPYPSAWAVRETLQLLQKLFPVRQCRDSFYRSRTRPCLQYQIKRCTGPCVGLVRAEDYALDVQDSIKFLEGRTDEVIAELGQRMEQAAEALEFERAATLRDQIATLQRIQQRQYVTADGGDVDIIAAVEEAGTVCVQVFFIRGGRNLGNKAFFPQVPADADQATVLSAFLAQFYVDKEIPPEVLLNAEPDEAEFLTAALSERAGRRVALKHRLRAERARWVEMAVNNAALALKTRLGSRAGYARRLEALRDLLGLDALPQRMECFDISHTRGELTVASCVVFDDQGPRKSDYRRFNIDGITPGDDYAAMEQALLRRYRRVQAGEVPLPDLLFIDGGKGQLSAVMPVLDELGIDGVKLVGVSKGPDRKAGAEQLWLAEGLADGDAAIIAGAESPALHLVQQIRDEAHRFAITGHRQRRDKARRTSTLEGIPGIGPKRRQNLLRAFGGLRGLARAAPDDIARVDGISRELARQIHDALHAESERT
ncbi:excinuclease ABC subunit C [Lamprobacter modestohalophilus]|uniref:UvrABC system protein C n=1 Tax=Lamprobacter modestohalophilus TaxID=1064514 RepID=A0A9X0W995_9GAMM|nr:excinuclease ABC subunit UvrC [Lamprobacter modestohalophilus]MBK1619166.1 excinuclease ABC subunit C [Lamprobacter modestohalophilus]MCF8003245.1 excinuclease ABC subunit UvrC [Chromatiaceae bacterium]